jgi:pantoate--beta-alanine ligase
MLSGHHRPLVATTRADLARALDGHDRADRPSGPDQPDGLVPPVGDQAAGPDQPAGSDHRAGPDQQDAVPARRRAVVMTMGALHAGHLELVREARRLADQVVVTIFVNPLQFGPGEDYDSYPRTLDADVALLASVGVDVVFAPTLEEMYPDGTPIVSVTSGRIGTVLEGASRPGHFDGVLTVVLKLLHLTAPDVAVFGEKDAQQLLAVRRMVHDLDVPVTIHSVPIVRDADGLALSSRNAYLSGDERAGGDAARAGASADAVRAAARQTLAAAPGVDLDYLVLVDPATVDDVPADHTGPALLLVAARVGTTRLIDTMSVDLSVDPAVDPPADEPSTTAQHRTTGGTP